MTMPHGVFGIDSRRDPARERLAPLLAEARLQQRPGPPTRGLGRLMRLRRRQAQEACA
jgi:hypothetical protein